MAPKTVAGWLCDHAPTEMNAANIAANGYGRKLFLTQARLMSYSASFFFMAPLYLGLAQTP
jgi:hypothetical protein